MAAGAKIYEKLITDFGALKFENNTTIFSAVKAFFTKAMDANTCLIIPDLNNEKVDGLSSGNTETTREYGFRAVVIEELESTVSDSEALTRYMRMLNIQDSMLNYLQKEPSNLNAWGHAQTPSLNIFKIRVANVRCDTQRAENGYVALLDVSFRVSLNVVPQLL